MSRLQLVKRALVDCISRNYRRLDELKAGMRYGEHVVCGVPALMYDIEIDRESRSMRLLYSMESPIPEVEGFIQRKANIACKGAQGIAFGQLFSYSEYRGLFGSISMIIVDVVVDFGDERNLAHPEISKLMRVQEVYQRRN